MSDILDSFGNEDESTLTSATKKRFKTAGIWMVVAGISGVVICVFSFFLMLAFWGPYWSVDELVSLVFILYLTARSILLLVNGSSHMIAFGSTDAAHMRKALESYKWIWILSTVFCLAFLSLWIMYIGGFETARFGLVRAMFGMYI